MTTDFRKSGVIFDKVGQPSWDGHFIFENFVLEFGFLGPENPCVLISARVTSFFIKLAILFLKIFNSNFDSSTPKTYEYWYSKMFTHDLIFG